MRDNRIALTRGDSLGLWVSLEKNGEAVPFENGDTIYFTVKRSINITTHIIQKVVKTFDDGRAFIEINPDDTKNLPYGDYWYDVQFTDNAKKVHTIISPSFFTITPEVTYE